MVKSAQTDNHNPRAKLDLRRYFLNKYHAHGPIDVLDCCQGSGLLWAELRKEHQLTSYWGLDLKTKKGRLMIDSKRVLAQKGWTQNVVDVDTYGSPWKHWQAMLPNVSQPTTVFLTAGQSNKGITVLPLIALKAMGLGGIRITPSIQAKLAALSVPYLLATRSESVKIVEALEAESRGNARYFGVRLEVSEPSA